MRQLEYTQVVILSAELANLSSEENSQRTFNLQTCLDDLNIGYNSAIGVYKYNVETSLVVLINNIETLQVLQGLAFDSFKQDFILYQDKQGESYLIYNTLDREHLGKLRKVHKHKVKNKDSYTYMNNSYYSIVA